MGYITPKQRAAIKRREAEKTKRASIDATMYFLGTIHPPPKLGAEAIDETKPEEK